MTDLDALIERVQGLSGPDRATDYAVYRFFNPPPARYDSTVVADPLAVTHLPPVTSSLDTVLALVERKLPGWAWKVGTCSVSDDAWLVPDFNCPVHGGRLRREFGYPDNVPPGSIWDVGIDIDRRPPGHPELAMLEAFLRALRATGGNDHA